MSKQKISIWSKNSVLYSQNKSMLGTDWITINAGYVPASYNTYYYKYFIVPMDGVYTLYASFDDMGSVYINGKPILKLSGGKYGWKKTYEAKLNLKKGGYVIEVDLTNIVNHSSTGFALKIVNGSGYKILQTNGTWLGYTTHQDWHNFIPKQNTTATVPNQSTTPTTQNTRPTYNPSTKPATSTTQTNTSTVPSYTPNYTTQTYTNTPTNYTAPTQMSMGGSEIENIFKKYGVYIAVGLVLMLLLRRK